MHGRRLRSNEREWGERGRGRKAVGMGRACDMQTHSDADMMCNVTINVSSAFRHKVALDPRRQCRLSTCTISHLMELPIGPDILLPHSHRLVRLLDAECLHLCRVLLQHFGTIRKFDEGRGLRGGSGTHTKGQRQGIAKEGRPTDLRFDSNLRRLRRDLLFPRRAKFSAELRPKRLPERGTCPIWSCNAGI